MSRRDSLGWEKDQWGPEVMTKTRDTDRERVVHMKGGGKMESIASYG